MVWRLAYRILTLDDSNLIRRTVSGTLVAAGYVLRKVVGGLDAIGKLSQKPTT